MSDLVTIIEQSNPVTIVVTDEAVQIIISELGQKGDKGQDGVGTEGTIDGGLIF